ncbi:MAG: FtsQ-type POTRA domain-containing protein [Candidatus Hydrogenedentota bacterium]
MRRRAAQQKKKNKVRKHRVLRAYVSPVVRFLVICALLWGGGYAFSRYLRDSDHYRIKEIHVSGTRVLTPKEVEEASYLSKRDNILFLDPTEVAGRVETLPRVKRCSVTRIFPDVVSLVIVERRPVVTLVVNNHTFEVDEEGVVLEEVGLDDEYSGPLITLHPPLNTVTAGERIDRAELFRGLAVWKAFAKTVMCEDVMVSEIAVHGDNDIRMYCDTLPFEIRWGRGNLDTQAQRLDILWNKLAGCLPCTQYLDLRFGRDLACK